MGMLLLAVGVDLLQVVLFPLPDATPFWKRCVDDICTVLHPEKVQPFHCNLNSIEPSIQFAYELEANGVLPFLDTEVMHHLDGSLYTKVYRKKTHTGKYLDFQSHHPLAYKLTVPRTLFK